MLLRLQALVVSPHALARAPVWRLPLIALGALALAGGGAATSALASSDERGGDMGVAVEREIAASGERFLEVPELGTEIRLEQSLWFPSPRGQFVEVAAGSYEVSESREDELLVRATDGEETRLAAVAISGDETLEAAFAILEPGDDDSAPAITLVLASGDARHATGSPSAVAERWVSIPCAPGYFRATRAAGPFSRPRSVCEPCPPGYRCVANNKYRCDASPHRFYTGSARQRACSRMPFAAYGNTASATTSWEWCPAGSYCGKGARRPCPSGAFCPARASIPKLCPAGFYCPANSATGAPACPIGSYCPPRSAVPVACPAGKTTLAARATTAKACSLNVGWVKGATTISASSGGFSGSLDGAVPPDGGQPDRFGSAAIVIGDLDHDGVKELAVGAYGDNVGHVDDGSVWILFMNANDTVRSQRKIGVGQAGFTSAPGTSPLGTSVYFGSALAPLGDLDGDAVPDLAVGAPRDYHYASGQWVGAIHLLFLNADGSVKSHVEIGRDELASVPGGGMLSGWPAKEGGFGSGTSGFGSGLAFLGDPDNDGFRELAVGADGMGDLWILDLSPNGTLHSALRIQRDTAGQGFGAAVTVLGDLDGDGVEDLAVGSSMDHDGCPHDYCGSTQVVFLNKNGSVKGMTTIPTQPRLSDEPSLYLFGSALAAAGDVDGDGHPDLLVGGRLQHHAWLFFLNPDGGVKGKIRYRMGESGFAGPAYTTSEEFAASLGALGDRDNDGHPEFLIGAPRREDGRGSVYLVEILRKPRVPLASPAFPGGIQPVPARSSPLSGRPSPRR